MIVRTSVFTAIVVGIAYFMMPSNLLWPNAQQRINQRIASPGSCSRFGKISAALQKATANESYERAKSTLKLAFNASPSICVGLVDLATQPALEYHPHFRPTRNQEKLPGYWFGRDVAQQPDLTRWELDHDSYDVLLIYFHGGAFFVGHSLMYGTFMTNLVLESNLRIRILAIEYELADKKRPETQYPYQHRTLFDAYVHLLEMGVPAEKMILGGDSSGGFNTLKAFEHIIDEKVPKPGGILLNSPLIDLWLPRDKEDEIAHLGPGNSLEKNGKNDYVGATSLKNGLAAYKAPISSAPVKRGPEWYADHLPQTFLVYGSGEVLMDYIVGFKEEMDKAGADLVVFRGEGEAHVFNVLEPKYSKDKGIWREAHVALVKWLGRFGKEV